MGSMSRRLRTSLADRSSSTPRQARPPLIASLLGRRLDGFPWLPCGRTTGTSPPVVAWTAAPSG